MKVETWREQATGIIEGRFKVLERELMHSRDADALANILRHEIVASIVARVMDKLGPVIDKALDATMERLVKEGWR
jgi:hypothetical protein